MSDRNHNAPAGPESDEVQGILGALHELAPRAPNPVTRLYLEEARQDIARLAGVGDEYAAE